MTNDSTEPMDPRTRLQVAGLRATRPRIAVYDVLRKVGGHHSVDELVGLLAERGLKIPRMSVYNVIADLIRAGLVMCAYVGPGCALYEANEVWHHHFVCRSCGKVEDVPCLTGIKPCLEPLPAVPGIVEEAHVMFRGICDDCATRPAAAEPADELAAGGPEPTQH
jgi:Fur family ferric uptake transcriptional regulator